MTGTALLGASLAAPPASGLFYGLGLLSAAAWIGGVLLSGPIRWWDPDRSSVGPLGVAAPVVLGVALFAAFAAVKLVGDEVPLVSESVARVLERADAGPRALVLAVALISGLGEELLFRGALHSAFEGRHPTAWTTGIYAVVTIATVEVSLVAAAVVMGLVFSAERRVTRGVLAPVLTHLTWSTLVLFFLPR